MVGPLYEAMGLLHPWPTLVVMPDDPRLGEYREVFAGMLGQFEENPQEGPDDTPGFAGSSKLVGADKFVERLDETWEHRVDAAEYLTARLIQFMVADSDRGSDQWRFARFPNESGEGNTWRPVARDHDFAFMRPGGAVGNASTMAYPKLTRFDDTFESLRTLTYMTSDFDRRLLVELPRERWDSVVAAMQAQLTDDVLRAAAARIPDEWEPYAAARVLEGLQGRRDGLREIAGDFFDMVSYEADVHGTVESERAEVERHADGSVEVRLYAMDDAAADDVAAQPGPPRGSNGESANGMLPAPFFQRRFQPGETREIRLYMFDGDDVVRVSGRSDRSIRVRVIGGGGDDVLADSSVVAQGGWMTRFYTAHGTDGIVRGPNTRIDSRSFAERLPGRPLDIMGYAPDPDAPEDDDADDEAEEDEAEGEAEGDVTIDENVGERLVPSPYRDWDGKSGVAPSVEFRGGSGLLIGASVGQTRYGFRREDYKYHVDARAMYSVDTGGFGVEAFGDYRPENTHLGLSLDASATQYETFRFYGYGNDTDGTGSMSPRVYRDQVTLRPAVYWADETTYIGIGPIFRYGNPRYDDGGPMALQQPLGADAFAQAGAAAALRLSRGVHNGPDANGYALDAGGSAYPALLDVNGTFGEAHAAARAWIPLGWPFLALRAGGKKLWGTFPVHEAAFIGGRNSLRGFETDRLAGDASVFGSTELHAPLGTIELLVRGEVGVFGLADAGRVYMDGDSPGSWHTSLGGGAWFYTLGRTVSLSYARGDISRFYLRLGMPF